MSSATIADGRVEMTSDQIVELAVGIGAAFLAMLGVIVAAWVSRGKKDGSPPMVGTEVPVMTGFLRSELSKVRREHADAEREARVYRDELIRRGVDPDELLNKET